VDVGRTELEQRRLVKDAPVSYRSQLRAQKMAGGPVGGQASLVRGTSTVALFGDVFLIYAIAWPWAASDDSQVCP
jgi:hypothetical protein